MKRTRINAWIAASTVVLVAAGLLGSIPASADPPYSPGAPFNGSFISPALGTPVPYSWCAYDASGTGAAGSSQQTTGTLSLVPVAAIPCLLSQFKTEEATNGITSERLSYQVIGQSAGGRDLYGVVVNDLESAQQQQNYANYQTIRAEELIDPDQAKADLASFGNDIKIPIYVENNIHGDEFEGADSMMQILRDLTTTPYGTNSYVDEILDHAILITVPNENPDGRSLNQRANGANFDMNRDWLVQSQSEVRAERDLIQQWIPTVGLATHGYVNPTLVDGLTKPHNPGIEYDIQAYWNERRLDANQAAYAGIGFGITRPRGANGLTGFTAYCSAGSGVTTTCGTNNTIAASPGGLVESGNTVTVTTTAALNINNTPGAQVTITGAGVAAYNGTWTITAVPTATTYTFTHPTSGLAASGGGTSAPKPGPANAEGWDDWGPFYTQTYLAFMGPDSSTMEMCQTGSPCGGGGKLNSKKAQYVGFWASADYWVTHRTGLMNDQLEIFRRGVHNEDRIACCNDPLLQARGWLPLQQDWSIEYPKAFIIPFNGGGQRSNGEANRMAQWLLDNGIQVQKMTSSFTWNATTYPAGSYVVSMSQALRGLAYTTLAAGQDVSQRITQLYAPPGAWSHGLLWGADTVEVPRGDGSFTPSTTTIASVNSLSAVGGINGGTGAPSDFYSYTLRGNTDFHAIQDLLHSGVTAEMTEASFVSTTGGSMPAGTLLFRNDAATKAALQAEGQLAGITFERNVAVVKPAVTQITHAPRVAILVNSANPARSDTTETLKKIFGTDAQFLSVTTTCGTCPESSIQNAATDPLLNYDVIYNTGQAYPGAATTARTRMNAFFTRGGGYIASSQSTTGFTFMTTAGNALVGGTFTGTSASAGGGIAKWTNVGGSASPVTGGYPGTDYLYLPSNVTYFSATPTGAVVDGRYLANMGDGTNGPTAGFVAGLWRTRSTATNNAPVIVHGTMQAPYTGRYVAYATNPFSRGDGEREWPVLQQAALWSNVADEPISKISFPADGGLYHNGSYDNGCSTPTGDFCGTAAATAGPGLFKVKVAVERLSNNTWWNGSSFASATPVYADATGAASWSYAFPRSNFPAEGDYLVKSKAVDNAGNEELDDQHTFTFTDEQTINFTPIVGSHTYLDPPFGVSASASSGLDVYFTALGNCSVSGGLNSATVTLTGAGSCTITAHQDGDAEWNAAPTVSQTFPIAKAAQTITFNPLPDKTYNDPNFSISATAPGTAAPGSTGPVYFTSSTPGVCTIVAGPKVHIAGGGTCTVVAHQDGNNNYNAAPNVARSFTVNQKTTITKISSIVPKKVHGSGMVTFTAKVKGGGPPAVGLTVEFRADGVTLIGSAVTNANGIATLTVSNSLPVGLHQIRAVSMDNADFSGSVSSAKPLKVKP